MRIETQLTLADESEEYRSFVEKFKPKKTTDDCYTPENVYEVVADWVSDEYGVNREDMVRPFFPGGDYERHDYPDGCCVVDNPPFSILSEIKRFYLRNGIHFFLFAPTMTLFGGEFDQRQCFLPIGAEVTYANGASVSTSFVTDLDTGNLMRTAPDLYDAISQANDENVKQAKKHVPKYEYPDSILTAARASWLCKHHTEYAVRKGEAIRVTGLDAQRGAGKAIFGGGLFLSERAAAERAAAERAAAERAAAERAAAERAAAERWQLSPREIAIQKMIGARELEEVK